LKVIAKKCHKMGHTDAAAEKTVFSVQVYYVNDQQCLQQLG